MSYVANCQQTKESRMHELSVAMGIVKIAVKVGLGKCADCDSVFEVEHFYDSCPTCGSNLKGIIQGKELRVKALEVV